MPRGDNDIIVYADWEGLAEPLKLGLLHSHAQAGHEVFEFEYSAEALAHPHTIDIRLDPMLGNFGGRQFAPHDKANFGLFLDSSPDRWGKLLMNRRLERAQRKGEVHKSIRLMESDYLLGVHDMYRVGALRFKLDENGPFLDDDTHTAAPPFVRLRELEHASRSFEQDDAVNADLIDEWLRILIAPGGSLGGARPKASVVDPEGQLWIAKFPSIRDESDIGAWELLTYTLAEACGLRVADAAAQKFASDSHTFMIKRFDRTADGLRKHFASAMTLTGHSDGDDASTGVSYLELAQVLIDHGAQTNADLHELWTRIVFNMCVSNTDDHLRNHGFILVPNQGWKLSEVYDMNPAPHSAGLKLNVSETDNALDLELALTVAHLFRLGIDEAKAIITQVRSVVGQWRNLANGLGISRREQEAYAPAFRLAD